MGYVEKRFEQLYNKDIKYKSRQVSNMKPPYLIVDGKPFLKLDGEPPENINEILQKMLDEIPKEDNDKELREEENE